MVEKIFEEIVSRSANVGAWAAVDVILSAFKRNGIEKTLQDLREIMGEFNGSKGDSEELYQDFLSTMRDIHDMLKEKKQSESIGGH